MKRSRAKWRVTSVLTQAKPWRRRKSLPPSMSNPPGMERHVVAEPKNKRPPLAVFYSVNTTGFVISPPHTARKGACEGGTFAGFSLKMRPIAPNGALQAFCRRQNLGTGGIHFRRARPIPVGWSGEPPRNPKIKDRRWRSFIFGASDGT